MISRNEAVKLAELVRTIRPDWDALLTINQLCRIPGTSATVAAHAMTVAADRSNRTPMTLTWEDATPVVAGPAPAAIGGLCATCGRTRTACETARRNAEAIGNDVHQRHPGRQWRHVDRHEFRTGT